MTSLDWITREEVLGGLTARRASTLLFVIKSRTAHLVAQSRQALNRSLTEEGERRRDLAFWEAFALGREPPLQPTIQDLERYAPEWRSLVPDSTDIRAVVAHLLADEFAFTHASVPHLRAALDLDNPAVQQAYLRRYGQPLETIYQPHLRWRERLRWAGTALASQLEGLPPFWTAFALTLTETVGSGILALPIALASIGPLPGLVILIVLGLANVLTATAMAESVARTGSMRYGNAFFGRLVSEYLGRAGSMVLIVALAGHDLISMLGAYIGVSSSLADVAPVRAEIWMLLLFLVGLYFMSRGSLDSTITSALVVGAVNISVILILAFLAATRLRVENLTYANVPLLNGRPLDPLSFQLIFGVVLSAYFGHSAAGNCGKIVLKRDPSARSLVWGTAAAQLTAVVLYCLWLLAIQGAIPAAALAGEKGTALAPLAATVGPLVNVFGLVLVLLGMGMGSVYHSCNLSNLVREQLPEPTRPIVILMRGGRLSLQPRRPGQGPRLTLTYLGLPGSPTFALERADGTHCETVEMVVTDSWEDAGLKTRLDVLDASTDHVRLQVTSPLAARVEDQGTTAGVHLLDALLAPGAEPPLVRWLLRRGRADLAQVADYLGQDGASARVQLTALIEKGLVYEEREDGRIRYRVRLGQRARRKLPTHIWQALDTQPAPPRERRSRTARLRDNLAAVLSARATRFWLGAAPTLLILIVAEGLVLTSNESFTKTMNLSGALAAPIFAGVFPVLLLASSRRKGNVVPQTAYRFLGHPLLLAVLYSLFLSSLFVHGLFIWQAVPERAAALLSGGIVVGMTVYVIYRGALTPRVVVEWRQEGLDQAYFAATLSGASALAQVKLQYRDHEVQLHATEGRVPDSASLRRAQFEIDTPARELQVWAHQVSGEGHSTPLPMRLIVSPVGDQTAAPVDVRLTAGPALVPLTWARCRIELVCDEPVRARNDSSPPQMVPKETL